MPSLKVYAEPQRGHVSLPEETPSRARGSRYSARTVLSGDGQSGSGPERP